MKKFPLIGQNVISPLLTDLYQLTMAYGYWKLNMHEREAVFHQIYRKNPFGGNFAVACGLGTVIEFLQNWQFQADDLAYLSGLQSDGLPLFSPEFLAYLKDLRFTGDVFAVPEGTVVFPNEPLIRIQAPLIQGQLIESTLLNIVNFQTLIATKAARVCRAAQGDPVLEFGLRRAQGPDGALSASRAAYIGGCAATSNVLAGKQYDIPVRGTHAHSWVTAFANEKAAFNAYAEVMPHNCVLLVDTFDTLNGVKHAIEIGKELRAQGAALRGVRLDSGDMTSLSIKARKLLDEAGFADTQIIASNSLDEKVIQTMKQQGAQVSVWGVGTSLVTAYDHPALDGVYKLSALRNEQGQWEYKLKVSEQSIKTSNPGIHQIRRFFNNDEQVFDVMYDIQLGIPSHPEIVELSEPNQATKIEAYTTFVDLLQPIFQQGQLIAAQNSIHAIREYAQQQSQQFLKNYINKSYIVGLEKQLFILKQNLVNEVKKQL